MLFDIFRRKKNKNTKEVISEADNKWNRMWDLWAEGEIESPYNELMTYQSEVNNGGHHQFFLNTENNGDIRKEIEALCSILPNVDKDNIHIAFKAYIELEQDKNIDTNEKIIEKCDNVFYRTFEWNKNIKRYQMMNDNVFAEFCVYYKKYIKIRKSIDRIENDF